MLHHVCIQFPCVSFRCVCSFNFSRKPNSKFVAVRSPAAVPIFKVFSLAPSDDIEIDDEEKIENGNSFFFAFTFVLLFTLYPCCFLILLCENGALFFFVLGIFEGLVIDAAFH